VPEDNADMHRSYIMLDPDGCFYQREGSGYLRSAPILDVGAATALQSVEFDAETYFSRY
jgi:radical S-adenosyl methionine domain-containing protein 2